MKVIFLDFWGVMDGPHDLSRTHGLSPKCGARIASLCERTDAFIVISSDAVKLWSPEAGTSIETQNSELARRFHVASRDLNSIGVPHSRIIGCTLQLHHSNTMFTRPAEIRAWLNEHPEVTHYVIFDDKPLPFTSEQVESQRRRLNESKTEESERLLAMMIDADPEMATRFVHVDGSRRIGLTDEHVELAFAILESP